MARRRSRRSRSSRNLSTTKQQRQNWSKPYLNGYWDAVKGRSYKSSSPNGRGYRKGWKRGKRE